MLVKKLMSLWEDPEFLSRVARWVPYFFIAAGFAVAISGQWVRTKVDSRVEVLRGQEANRQKQIPPSLDAHLGTSQKTGDLLVVIDAKNTTPFRARWLVVTREDRVVSGIMMSDVEIHPTEDRKRFTSKADVKPELVVDQYVELHLQYSSLYSAELGDPPELRGEIRRPFRFVGGKVQHWVPVENTTDLP